MSAARSIKRRLVAAAHRVGALGYLVDAKRSVLVARSALLARRSRSGVRTGRGDAPLDSRTRRTGFYLARRTDHVDPYHLTAETVGAVRDLLDELDIGWSLTYDEAGMPVVVVDDEAWTRLDEGANLDLAPADLHVRSTDPSQPDRPLSSHEPGWLRSEADAPDHFWCFLARSGDEPHSLIGPEYAVAVRATRSWGRPMATGDRDTASLARLIQDRQEPPFPIDAVFAWVDGDDPAWQRRRSAALGTTLGPVADAAAAHRFKSRDELRYSLRSILLYAPWLRNIFIVTDAQRPAWLADHPRVRVVDHREILPDDVLPTFNSHVIESALYLTPGLSEQYIYFNDDMMFGAPVRWTDFFTAEGTAKFFMSSARVPTPWTELKTIDYANLNAQRLLRERFGTEIDRKIRHTPYAQRRAVHEWMAAEFADEVTRTQAASTRSETDQSFSSYLHHFVGRELGLCSSSRIRSDYFGVDDVELERRLRSQLERRDPVAVLCLNDEDLPADEAERVDRTVAGFFEAAYPFTAPWETA